MRIPLRIPTTLRLVAPRALLIWAVTRIVLIGATLTAASWERWHFWDAAFYGLIVSEGYAPVDPRLAAYFPLYPALIRVVMLGGAPWHAAALIVSSLAFLAALIAIGWVADGDWIPMLLLAASPLAFFLSGMYADGLFLACAAGALLTYRHERWALCGILAALAVIARPFGMALVAALILAALVERRGWRVWLWLLALPGLLLECYATLLYIQYRNPLEFVFVEHQSFGRSALWPWQTVLLQEQEFLSMPAARLHMLLDIVPVIIVAVTLTLMARHWPLAWTLYVAFALLLILVSPVTSARGQYAMVSDGRYTYAAVPVLFACATWLERLPRPAIAAILAASFALQIGLTVFVLHGGWIV